MILAVAGLVFVVAAAVVWAAGTRLSGYADTISRRLGIGQALIGLFLLGGVTSLPEIAVSISAAAVGDTALALNNLFGSIAMQVAILAVIDFAIGRRALTSVAPDPNLLLLGTLNVLLLAIAAAGMVVGDTPFFGVGLWAWASLVAYVFCLWLLAESEGRQPWVATGGDARHATHAPSAKNGEDGDAKGRGPVPRDVILRTFVAAVLILAAGYSLSRSAEVIAVETGLGSSFVGFVLLAISTSLPEFSSALAAARRGLIPMAISDILGTNLINVGLVFVVDAVARGEPVLNLAGDFSIFGALLGIVVTALLLMGLAERSDKTVFRVGMDSAAVAIVYLGGLFVLYALRDAT